MDDKKKIQIFDRCINEKIQDHIDKLNETELSNLCTNVNKLVTKNSTILKIKIKSLSKKK